MWNRDESLVTSEPLDLDGRNRAAPHKFTMLGNGEADGFRIDGRREAAHSAVDKVYDSVRSKIELLREKRQLQGEVFVKIQKRRIGQQQEMRDIRSSLRALEDERVWLRDALESRWLKASRTLAQSGAATVRINVGGHCFETSADVLSRAGKGSVLADIAASAPKSSATGSEQVPFIARDWWLFRHVLQFLRDGDAALPRSKPLLKQLYQEARFLKCEPLRTAVRLAYQRIAAAEAELPPMGKPVVVPSLPPAPASAPLPPVSVSEAGMAAAVAAASGLPPPGGPPGQALAGGGPWQGLVGAPAGGGLAAGQMGGVVGGQALGWGAPAGGILGAGSGTQWGPPPPPPASAVYPTPMARAAARAGAIAPLAPMDASIAGELGLGGDASRGGGASESKSAGGT